MTEVTNAAAEAAEIASLLRPHFDTPAVGIDRIGQRETALGRGHLLQLREPLSAVGLSNLQHEEKPLTLRILSVREADFGLPHQSA